MFGACDPHQTDLIRLEPKGVEGGATSSSHPALGHFSSAVGLDCKSLLLSKRVGVLEHVVTLGSPPGSDLLHAGEVPVSHMADGAGEQLGGLRPILRLHGAVQRTRVQERNRE